MHEPASLMWMVVTPLSVCFESVLASVLFSQTFLHEERKPVLKQDNQSLQAGIIVMRHTLPVLYV